ncbi:hypothetical protein [Leifsonia sp. Leaf264]|uniref:hypothetical protein n=1 Tax=Leifsonia sp. Leaf264 TaxID=1736314 RepID=UPI0006FC6571|nr:hypothetical protein [Leifsonia sp. Leaf264]KQO98305.1 hypothetical protein ASF30_09605 [Leifsonia sp. Leaf264]
MKKILTVVASALAVAALAACSPISSGTITGKHYEPAYTYVSTTCAAYDSKGNCSVTMPLTNYVDDEYRLDITRGGKDGWVIVSEHTYDGARVGDYFSGGDVSADW